MCENYEYDPPKRYGKDRAKVAGQHTLFFFWNLQRGPSPGGGGMSPTQGRQGPPSLYKPWPPFSCHLSLKIQKKKRGVRRRKAAKLC